MKAYRLILLGAVGLAVAGWSLVGCLSMATPGVTRENFQKLKSDMTRSEVIQILGQPKYGPGEFRDYPLSGTGDGLRMAAQAEVWESDTCRIYVHTENGVVRGLGWELIRKKDD